MMRFVAPWYSLNRHEGEPEPTSTEPAPTEEPKPLQMTQQQLQSVIDERLRRQKAQFADYDDLKARAARLDEIEAASKSELERERDARAKAETTAAEATRRATERIAAAELKAALTGITDNPTDIVDDLNLARYITPEGEVDAEAVAKLRDRYSALAKPLEPARPKGDIDQGHQGGEPVNLRTSDRATLQTELAKYGLRTR